MKQKRVTAVVLAAGRATRFSGPKLLAPVPDRPLIRTTVEKLVGLVDAVVVVLGHESDAVVVALGDAPVRTVINPEYEDGLGTSVAAGVSSLRADDDGVMIALGDQPIPVEVLARLLAVYREGNASIVAPVYDGVLGNPVVFDRQFFGELKQLQGDRGARALVEANRDQLVTIDFAFAPPIDVDTAEDYGLLMRQMLEPPRA